MRVRAIYLPPFTGEGARRAEGGNKAAKRRNHGPPSGYRYLHISIVEKQMKNKEKPLARLRERGRGEGVRPQDESRQAGQTGVFCPPPSLRDTSSRKREKGLSAVFKKIFSHCEMGRYLWPSGKNAGFSDCRQAREALFVYRPPSGVVLLFSVFVLPFLTGGKS